MTPTNSDMVNIISSSLSPEQLQCSFIYWHKKTIRRGEDVRLGLQTIVMPFEGTMVFVDLAPRSNWAHPCLYLLVDAITQEVKVTDASFPPAIDHSDLDYVIILRLGHEPLHERYFNAFDT
jgi:hypothetical protein